MFSACVGKRLVDCTGDIRDGCYGVVGIGCLAGNRLSCLAGMCVRWGKWWEGVFEFFCDVDGYWDFEFASPCVGVDG